MNLPIAILLIVLLIVGIGLFVRACTAGMRFGDRLEEEKKAAAELARRNSGAGDGTSDDQRPE